MTWLGFLFWGLSWAGFWLRFSLFGMSVPLSIMIYMSAMPILGLVMFLVDGLRLASQLKRGKDVNVSGYGTKLLIMTLLMMFSFPFFFGFAAALIVNLIVSQQLKQAGYQKPRRNRGGGRSDEARREAGRRGEESVAYALGWLDKTLFATINGVVLRGEGLEPQEFDHIVVGPDVVFNVETKTYSGKIKIDAAGNWVRTDSSGAEEALPNPSFQVRRHHQVLAAILGADVQIIDVVVLAHEGVLLDGQQNSLVPVVRADALMDFIISHTPASGAAPDGRLEKLNAHVVRRTLSA